MGKMNIPAAPKQYAASYRNFSGVDFSSERRQVDPSRASFSRNMFKRYEDGYTEFVETRPGLTLKQNFSAEIYGVWMLDTGEAEQYIVHAGTSLYKLTTFDGTPVEKYAGMIAGTSAAIAFDKKLYIMDGTQYLVYDGEQVSVVVGTIPITSIGRTPTGGGTAYQAVNMLTPLRKNSFRADSEATEYYLDAKGLTTDPVTVWVDGKEKTDGYTVDVSAGKVTFETAPAKPDGGDDNVMIQFGVEVTNRHTPCNRMVLFDNRLFYYGNPEFPHVFWHSEVNDPAYISDVNYYKEGSSNSKITGMAVQDGRLIVLKDADVGSVWVHTPSTDYDLGRVYPADESVITVPCIGAATAFRDDLVYLSPYGLEGITYPTYTKTERIVRHRSTLIDRKLHTEDLERVSVADWRGYLCLLFGDHMYLADSNATYRSDGAFEYEWFYWDGIKEGVMLFCFRDNLYLAGTDGKIYCFDGIDDGEDENEERIPIQSEWVTRAENGGTNSMYKTVRDKGAVLLCKTISNSVFTVAVETDVDEPEDLCTVRMGGFSFLSFNFDSISFSCDDDNTVRIPLNRKKWKWMTIRFYSTTRFGINSCEYLYTVGNFIK